MLFGSLSFFLGMLSFAQIGFKLFVTSLGNRWWAMNIILIFLAILSYILPIYLMIKKCIPKIKQRISTKQTPENKI
jgi:hypothetical protein